jgi:hypothetical protein
MLALLLFRLKSKQGVITYVPHVSRFTQSACLPSLGRSRLFRLLVSYAICFYIVALFLSHALLLFTITLPPSSIITGRQKPLAEEILETARQNNCKPGAYKELDGKRNRGKHVKKTKGN